MAMKRRATLDGGSGFDTLTIWNVDLPEFFSLIEF
jgi:hypothetical protein